MLRFKNYLSERDLWLENWIMECEKYIMESPGFDISIERPAGLKNMSSFKSKDGGGFLRKVADNFGFSNFDFNSPQDVKRLGAGSSTIEEFQDLMQLALGLPEKPPIIAPTDSIEFQGNTYSNPSKKYFGIPVVGIKTLYVLLYAGLDTRSGNTRLQELAFLYILAGKYYTNSKISSGVVNMDKLNHVAKYIEEKGKRFKADDKTTIAVYDFLLNNSAWTTNWDKATDSFIKKGYSKPIKFVKDSTSFELNKQAAELFEKDGLDKKIKWDSDKWNPADVWICYQDENEITGDFSGIKDLNSEMKKYLDSRNSGIIGLSLKLGSKYTEVYPETGGYEILDNRRNNKFKDEEIENGFKLHYGKFFGQSVNQSLALLDYDKSAIPKESRHEIVYRLFTGKAGGPLVGEVKVAGTKAAHGKVYLEYIDVESGTSKISKTVKNATSKSVVVYDSKSKRYVLTKDGRRIFKSVSIMYKQLKRGVIENIVGEKIRTKKNERFEGQNNFILEYSILEKSVDDFEEYLNNEILQDTSFKKLKTPAQKVANLNIKISTRFQTIAFGGWWCRIYLSNRKLALSTALGMLHLAKSMNPRFSAPHAKIT